MLLEQISYSSMLSYFAKPAYVVACARIRGKKADGVRWGLGRVKVEPAVEGCRVGTQWLPALESDK